MRLRLVHVEVVLRRDLRRCRLLHRAMHVLIRSLALWIVKFLAVARLIICNQVRHGVILGNDLLQLLNLGLERQVGSLQVLDVLVLSLHRQYLHVKGRGSWSLRVWTCIWQLTGWRWIDHRLNKLIQGCDVL